MNIFNYRNEYGANMWNFEKITDHRKLPDNPWEVKVLWEILEEKWEPMHTIKEYEKLALAAYGRYKKLIEIPR